MTPTTAIGFRIVSYLTRRLRQTVQIIETIMVEIGVILITYRKDHYDVRAEPQRTPPRRGEEGYELSGSDGGGLVGS